MITDSDIIALDGHILMTGCRSLCLPQATKAEAEHPCVGHRILLLTTIIMNLDQCHIEIRHNLISKCNRPCVSANCIHYGNLKHVLLFKDFRRNERFSLS